MSIARTPNPRAMATKSVAAQAGTVIAAAVEELLLLAHHSQLGVVEQDDFNLDTFLGGGGELLHVHEQATVAAETSDGAAGAGDGRADGRRETEAHRAQAARKSAIGAAA